MKIPIDERHRLRGFRDRDINPMTRLADNPNLVRTLMDYFPHPYTRNDAVQFIAKCHEEQPQQTFVIEYDGDFCGVVLLKKGEDVHRFSAELGYWIGEPFWGKGILSKVIPAVENYGFGKLGLERIYARVFERNRASIRVLEKNGYTHEGRLQRAVFKYGEFQDQLILGKIRST